MKTKIILPFFLAIIILSFSAYANISCEITDAAACTAPSSIVLKLSDLSDGGSHAGTALDSAFPKVVCCSGVASLAASETVSDNFMGCLTSLTDGHMNQTGTKPPFATCLYLNAQTEELTCEYMPSADNCLGFEDGLFSISADNPGYSHISGYEADEYPYDNFDYCCRTGQATCTASVYWGVITFVEDPETGDMIPTIEPLTGEEDEPLGPVGGGRDVFLVAETSGCEAGTKADFIIYNDADAKIDTLGGEAIGMFEGELLSDENAAIAIWEASTTTDIYYFKVKLTKDMPDPAPDVDTISTKSSDLEVDGDGCQTLDPTHFCPLLTQTEKDACEEQCILLGDPCPDSDCDGVANCIDKYTGTVADPDLVAKCSGVSLGTAGCIPSMDCTKLLWSECKNCESGEECNKPTSDGGGGFSAGTMFMERTPCSSPGEGKCDCFWDANRDGEPDETAPPGCDLPGLLNQYNNRFKECIEDEEFPLFDGFNIIAVLLILSMYYTIAIIRKKK